MAMFNLEMIGTESKWGGIGLHYWEIEYGRNSSEKLRRFSF
jgi:hypothetical protein